MSGNAVAYRLESSFLLYGTLATLLSAVVDKGRRVFGNRSTVAQSLPQAGDLHSATNPTTSPSTTSQKNDARRDMSVLSMTYTILQDSPTIQEQIRLIIGLNDHDDSGKVCTTCN